MDTLIDRLECGRAQAREINCKEMFKARVKEYADDISASNIDRAMSRLDEFLNLVDQRLKDPNYPEDCKGCWQKLKPALSLQKRLINLRSNRTTENNVKKCQHFGKPSPINA